jgi:hypothetical protein
MKFILLILILISLISFRYVKPDNNSNVTLNATILNSNDELTYKVSGEGDTLVYRNNVVKISLINTSDKPVAFWMMSCSWDRDFTTSNDYLHFHGWNCDNNAPRIIRLQPNDSIVFKERVVSNPRNTAYSDSVYLKANAWMGKGALNLFDYPPTKLGLIYKDTVSCKNYNDYMEIRDDRSRWGKIIWSNAILFSNK